MSIAHYKYVLVGAGRAGSAAAAEIRRRDPAGSILLIGQETSRPYLRTALSKSYLRRTQSRMEIVLEPVGWYDQMHVELRTGRRVSHLDSARQTITLDNGDEIAFDQLLLAGGASPKPLRVSGAELPNVFYLRNINDCDRLHHAIDKAKLEGRAQSRAGGNRTIRGCAAVIGSGLLAVEVAASLRQMDLQVDLIAGREHLWSKFAGEMTGRFIARHLQNHGVNVHVGIGPDRIEGDGRVQRVALSNGTSVDCDFLVAAVGIVPNRDLVRNTPIAAEKAILVDDHCRTNVPTIYAAGDCAAVFDPLFGKHRVIDHWDSAEMTGKLAGANMSGADIRFSGVNSYTSEIFNLKLTAWGEGRLVNHRLLRGTPNGETADFAEIGVAADGRVAQVLTIGREHEHALLGELVLRRQKIDGNEELLKDPNQPLGAILK